MMLQSTGMDFKRNTKAAIVSCPCLVPLSLLFKTTPNSVAPSFTPLPLGNFLNLAFSPEYVISSSQLTVRFSDELGDSKLNTMCMTLKQNKKKKKGGGREK